MAGHYGRIDLSFQFRKDGQLSGGSREDSNAPTGYRFTDHILKSTKNRVGVGIAWISEEPPEGTAVDLDTDGHHVDDLAAVDEVHHVAKQHRTSPTADTLGLQPPLPDTAGEGGGQ